VHNWLIIHFNKASTRTASDHQLTRCWSFPNTLHHAVGLAAAAAAAAANVNKI